MSRSPMDREQPNVGSDDCKTCKTRRIVCDRGLPGCFKCSKKGHTCPGYGLQLRWAGGIAVRGHLKGLKRPPSPTPTPPKLSRRILGEDPESIVQEMRTHNEDLPTSWAHRVVGEVPNLPDSATIEKLLEYYDKKLSGMMVWLDSEENGYRRLVLPLARHQPVLLLSILAVSGNHLARTSGIESNFPKSACDTAVGLITSQVQKVTTLGDEVDAATAEWMLASMLTLAMYGMVEADSMDWLSHRQAARTLVKVLETTDQSHSELYLFLRNMLSVDDVLASTTSFDLESMNGVVLPENKQDNVLFGDYLKLIHRITMLTRKDSSGQISSLIQNPKSMSAREVRSGFELARGSTLIAFGKLQSTPGVKRRDFVRLVDAYHHAGLLYSNRCLQLDVPADREYSLASLYDTIEELEDIPDSAHYLPWPLFILGTECRGQPATMEFLRKQYHLMIEHIGFGQYQVVLSFLEEFWAGEDEDWLRRAREWNEKGVRLLIL